MTTIGGSWDVLLVGAGMVLILGLAFLFLTRPLGTPSVSVRCPISGHMDVVQHVADEGSYLTDLVTCRAFSPGRAVACGLPCLTGGVRTRIFERHEDVVKV